MDVGLFDYDLPPERIAQEAVEPRDAARLMVLDRSSGARAHHFVRDLPELLAPGDLVVCNDTRVLAARLRGVKTTGGAVELLLLERQEKRPDGREVWRALVGASRAPRAGAEIELPADFVATIVQGPDEDAAAVVELRGPAPVAELLRDHGLAPLPPYIRRAPDDPRLARDRERYQTIFAARPGAVAAPTAGLHFTPQLVARLAERGVGTAMVTLHVGEATFRPVRAQRIEGIVLPPERMEVRPETTRAIVRTRAAGRRVVAVGTTVVRALESRPATDGGGPEPGGTATRLFIGPGHVFRFVDALLTNFHLPRSTLLMLTAAFAGREMILDAYHEAVREGYRFYSYGDAMLIR